MKLISFLKPKCEYLVRTPIVTSDDGFYARTSYMYVLKRRHFGPFFWTKRLAKTWTLSEAAEVIARDKSIKDITYD